ncbi:hypothetical protein Cob_v012855 [Colletotrichum orbiculare MAFF 240422]|uniref:Uncharacterized protein n=1 Tax=Colletotrichum orbiculare (strain 104-T / ATCC 96160 / CBS 514.97 / LARS 414 / MAFF 240422) TaxID=1213857 RepID=A0A484F8L2_COLOR|nr:hypothetical protein Cob_v012855 [Colletotrichum orbiculare MAFF 240422]
MEARGFQHLLLRQILAFSLDPEANANTSITSGGQDTCRLLEAHDVKVHVTYGEARRLGFRTINAIFAWNSGFTLEYAATLWLVVSSEAVLAHPVNSNSHSLRRRRGHGPNAS